MKYKNCIKVFFIASAFCLILCGCLGMGLKSVDSKGSQPVKGKGPVPLYYDFGDVLVPRELKLDRKESFVLKSDGFSAGVMVLTGRVDPLSLIGFFECNMAKDNWRQVSSFKSKRTIMLFHKENRWCVINISEGDFKTTVEIWVAPTNETSG